MRHGDDLEDGEPAAVVVDESGGRDDFSNDINDGGLGDGNCVSLTNRSGESDALLFFAGPSDGTGLCGTAPGDGDDISGSGSEASGGTDEIKQGADGVGVLHARMADFAEDGDA